jgi:lysyl-tRNA synthetase class 1
MLLQIPGVDVAARVAAEKGTALTAREPAILDERARAARGWLDTYAPERSLVRVHEALPPEAADLSDAQRVFLGSLATGAADAAPASGDGWQDTIFSTATACGIDARTAFDALYRAFLGRTNGPRAGWLLASLDRAFVIGRLEEAAA